MRQERRATRGSTGTDRAPRQERPDPNVAILLREPFLAFIAELFRRLQDAGYGDLRISHLVVFQHIDPAGSRITELAAKAQMTKPSMAYLVEYLETTGYVERLPDPRDGRARLVHLTERGWRQIEDALDIIADMEAELGAEMRPGQLATLRRLLTSLGAVAARWR
jgi:DNA-binding MarR family transcriptional regulator